ncbi:MAG: SOS response-associated peptidase [Acidimicrobiia bacterium]|nr:SOS response-associated peptidase [Acidimicrobiia bacterium]MXY74480.1 SOS response-associated peptidase [Acidimicrobiia bacterium]MYB78304.1 SOS response-associated peptidase [Acidimicrobiia bacterium]
MSATGRALFAVLLTLGSMCGRFGQARGPDYYGEYLEADQAVPEPLPPSWNVAPTDSVYAFRHRRESLRIETMRWGLIPHWAPDLKTFHINARSETLRDKPLFRGSLTRRRCLIPADGFYEWTSRSRGHVPHWFFRSDGDPLLLAGLWGVRRHPVDGEWLVSCAIVTGPSEGPIAAVHHRMPVALPPDRWEPWLDPDLDDATAAQNLLAGPETGGWATHPVSRRVNKVSNNDSTLVRPVSYPAAPILEM